MLQALFVEKHVDLKTDKSPPQLVFASEAGRDCLDKQKAGDIALALNLDVLQVDCDVPNRDHKSHDSIVVIFRRLQESGFSPLPLPARLPHLALGGSASSWQRPSEVGASEPVSRIEEGRKMESIEEAREADEEDLGGATPIVETDSELEEEVRTQAPRTKEPRIEEEEEDEKEDGATVQEEEEQNAGIKEGGNELGTKEPRGKHANALPPASR